MIATLTLAALIAQQAAPQAVLFSPKFTKDETLSYTAVVTGTDDGNAMSFDIAFDLATKGEAKEGKTPCHIKFLKVVATVGGMEQNMEASDLELSLSKHGAPVFMDMEGATAVAYVSLVTQYLPAKEMKVGDTFFGDLDLGGAKVSLSGSYAGDETLDGKKYAVLKTKSTLTPTGEDAGMIETKGFFDAATGKVVRTESKITVPNGEFKLTVTAKPKKA